MIGDEEWAEIDDKIRGREEKRKRGRRSDGG